MASSLIRGDELFSSWKRELLSGENPIRWALADEDSPLNAIQAEPGKVYAVGGQPGSGKTALVLQLVTDGLRLSDELRVLVANVEMAPDVLLARQLSRLSGIDLNIIQDRKFTEEHEQRLHAGFSELELICGRLGFVKGPFTFENVGRAADELEPQILVLDYLQRFQSSASEDRRGGIDESMSLIRQFADSGSCVFVVSALARTKNPKGQTGYQADSLSLASFRDSSEIEFGVDDAYILATGKEAGERTLMHLKSRNGECRDIALEFDGAVQRFSGTCVDDIATQASGWWAK
jgi:replicative DNA helicase